MPEAPEVDYYTRFLKELLEGGRIIAVTGDLAAYFHRHTWQDPNNSRHQRAVKVTKIWHKGKYIIMDLDTGSYLVSHLGMTGYWVNAVASDRKYLSYGMRIRNPGSAHLSRLFFVDPRKLGSLRVMNAEKLGKLLAKLGPDILSSEFTKRAWDEAVTKYADSKAHIASILSNQSFVSGIGNYLRSEILYAARISPLEPAADVFAKKSNRLYSTIIKVAKTATKAGGLGAHGARGVPAWKPAIYGRERTASGRVVRTCKIDGRTVYY